MQIFFELLQPLHSNCLSCTSNTTRQRKTALKDSTLLTKKIFLRSNIEDYLEKRTGSIKSNENHRKTMYFKLYLQGVIDF